MLKIRNIQTDKKIIVIIGKNGSGKSMLLIDIQHTLGLRENIFIPAARGVHALKTNIEGIKSVEQGVRHGIDHRVYVSQADILFISRLFEKDYNYLRQQREHKEVADQDYIGLLNRILHKVSPEFCGVSSENFSLKANADYPLNRSSNGEKHVIVLICAILSAPEKAVLLIDEPEIGLHNAAVKDLFDELEKERADCTFVYATHNIDFTKTREDASIIYVCKKDLENLQEIKSDNLEKDLLVDINGIPKPILLVEGNETDRRLYTKIFSEYEVRNGDGCGQIKNRVKTVKDFFDREDIFGLLDGDNKDIEENEALEKVGCFSIPFAQHEHLYILPEVLQEYLNDIGKTEETSEEIILKAIKSAQDFSRHNKDDRINLLKKAKEIVPENIYEFFGLYRGKDLIGFIESQMGVKNIMQNMANKKNIVDLIAKHLDKTIAKLKAY